MNPKSDKWIRKNAREGMIEPFSEAISGENVISYGLTSFGYDTRIATEFRVFTPNAYNIEIGNATPLPAKVYAKEGIAQVVFFEGQRPQTTYNAKKGKYQGQESVTLPKVK